MASTHHHSDAAHAEAAPWLDYVAGETVETRGVEEFDASVTEAVSKLLRRGCISARAASCLLTFFDVPQSPTIAATVAAARMVPMPAQQQQCQHRPCPVEIGPSLYDVLGGIGARVGKGLGLKPAWLARKAWSAPVVTPHPTLDDVSRAVAEIRAREAL